MAVRPATSLWQRIGRLLHFRLIIPVKRSRHPPQFTARAVAVGIFWAFTPLIGIQMYLVFMTWLAARYSERTEFSLIVALPWTWLTNVFTLIPTYYVFYVTGQVILHGTEAHFGYRHFVWSWKEILLADLGIWETILRCLKLFTTEQGFPMAIGCLPYAIGGAWLGYRWSLRFVEQRRLRRAARALSNAKARSRGAVAEVREPH